MLPAPPSSYGGPDMRGHCSNFREMVTAYLTLMSKFFNSFSWLQIQQRKKQVSYSSFHEEMLAKSELQQKEQEKKQLTELNQQISKEEREAILEEVAKTQVIFIFFSKLRFQKFFGNAGFYSIF